MTFWVAGAMLGGAVIGSVGSSNAANTQAGAQQQAAATQQQMFNTINSQEQPFMQAGYGATSMLNDLLGIGTPTGAHGEAIRPGANGTENNSGLPAGYLTQQFNPTQEQLEKYPGYQFQLQTGASGLQNANTPGMGALSGSALKSLAGFNQGVAASNYGNYFNQYQQQQNNMVSRLSGIANIGQNAASNTGNAGSALGTGIAQSQAAAGASQAAGIVGSANAMSGGLNNMASYMMLNNLF